LNDPSATETLTKNYSNIDAAKDTKLKEQVRVLTFEHVE
jgi:hypothetical protein